MASTPISPKVHAAGISAAVVTLAMYLLDRYVPAIASMPAWAHGAVLVIVTGIVTYAAGYAKRDPLRKAVPAAEVAPLADVEPAAVATVPDYAAMSWNALRKTAKTRGLNAGGSKTEVVARLVAADHQSPRAEG